MHNELLQQVNSPVAAQPAVATVTAQPRAVVPDPNPLVPGGGTQRIGAAKGNLAWLSVQ